ncbi:MAG TPA: lipase secretion chaperone [Burkholderiaceae bacterium]|nr:lipase secretion chaperone [Burkholderiaceae bacterium]
MRRQQKGVLPRQPYVDAKQACQMRLHVQLGGLGQLALCRLQIARLQKHKIRPRLEDFGQIDIGPQNRFNLIRRRLDMAEPRRQHFGDVIQHVLDHRRQLILVFDVARERFTAMQRTRSQFFSAAESEAVFGFDDAYDMDALTRLEISQDVGLSEQQKQEKLAALDATLPGAVRAAKEVPFRVVRPEQAAQKMRTEGATRERQLAHQRL